MAIDIENPGADEAALRAAIQALVPISTTTISSPVNYVDIDLPSGYAAFQLFIVNMVTPDFRALVGAFSQDGGTVWLEDFATTSTNYSNAYLRRTNVAFTSGASDALGCLDLSIGDIVAPFSATVLIVPGSATRAAMATTAFSVGNTAGGETPHIGDVVSLCLVNTQRVNAVRLMPDNGSTGPSAPDVLYTLTSGSFTLYGVL